MIATNCVPGAMNHCFGQELETQPDVEVTTDGGDGGDGGDGEDGDGSSAASISASVVALLFSYFL